MSGLRGFVPWPAQVADQYSADGVWRGRSIWDEVQSVLAADPDKEGLIDSDGRWRFSEILVAADSLAGNLIEAGLEPDDVVVFQVPNRAESVVGWLGCLRAGVVPLMALPMHRSKELTHFIGMTGARAHLTTAGGPFDYVELSGQLRDRFPKLRTTVIDMHDLVGSAPAHIEAPRPVRAGSDLAHILVSGGSTGTPKLICRTHDDFTYNARCFVDRMQLDSSTVTLVQSPAAHNAALALLILPTLLARGTIVMAPSSRPRDTLPLLASEKPTYTVALPATVADWTQLPAADRSLLSSFRVILTGAYRLPPEVGHRAHSLGMNVLHGYGMAEGFCSFNRPDDGTGEKCDTVGLPMSTFDSILVVDEQTGDQIPPGEAGELLVRGPYTIRGYYDSPEANRRAFTDQGYFRTGDRAMLRPDSRLVILGRIGDVINRGGEKIDPTEVEDTILLFDGVDSVTVFAVPDERLGQRPAAAVIPTPGSLITLEAISQHLTEAGIAVYKQPEVLLIVEGFPLTTAGKIDRRALAALCPQT